MQNLSLLYPELQEIDGLPQAIQREFSHSLLTFEIKGKSFSELMRFMELREDGVFYHLPTKIISKNGRWVDIDIALERRLFILTMGENGDIAQAFLETISLQDSYSIIHDWLIDIIDVAQLKEIDSAEQFLDLRDDIQYVRWQWAAKYRQAVNAGIFTRLLAPILACAMQDPMLNRLTPFTSHDTLYLSRYIEFPFDHIGLPVCSPLHSNSAEYTQEKFEVFSNGSKIGIGNAEIATKLMREALPKNIVRAIRHT